MIKDIKVYSEIIEGLLYLSGAEGVSLSEILLVLKVDQMTVEEALKFLEHKYETNSGLELIYTNNTYKLVTKNSYYEYYKEFANLTQNDKLGNSALETLAIIAYNQPITKFQIEQLKGVSIQHNIQALINKELIYISGRSQEIGKPNLYSTTGNFLDYIGINNLEELPELDKFSLNIKEEELLKFTSLDYKEIAKKLLTAENTIKLEKLDEQTMQELDSLENLKLDFEMKE
ncbi:MAG: SMC-Scp complex subunit ScpB [Mycoplasmatales bacterium]